MEQECIQIYPPPTYRAKRIGGINVHQNTKPIVLYLIPQSSGGKTHTSLLVATLRCISILYIKALFPSVKAQGSTPGSQ